MKQSEVENTTTTRGPVWAFKIKGVPYTFDDSFTDWLSK